MKTNHITDKMVDAYLTAQRAAVEEADRFGRPNVGGLHSNTVREACRAGLAAALAASPIVDMVPPATSRDRWMFDQGRLAERDPRSHSAVAGVVQLCPDCDIADCRHIRAARTPSSV